MSVPEKGKTKSLQAAEDVRQRGRRFLYLSREAFLCCCPNVKAQAGVFPSFNREDALKDALKDGDGGIGMGMGMGMGQQPYCYCVFCNSIVVL